MLILWIVQHLNKPKNEIFARHVLAIRYQHGESMDSYFQELRSLAKDCNFVAVNAATYADESIRDSFISGIQSPLIRQRLLENSTLTLTQAFDQARALDLAQQNSERYVQTQAIQNPQTAYVKPVHSESTLETNDPTMAAVKKKCTYCGNDYHLRYHCPARNVTCHKCSKKGHFSNVCMSSANPSSSAVYTPSLATITAGAPNGLMHTTIEVLVNGKKMKALIDSGSSESHTSFPCFKRQITF